MIIAELKTEIAQGRLSRIAREIEDRRAVNKGVAAKLTALVFRNFDNEAREDEPWAALAPRTIKHKEKIGKQRKLQVTGALRQSFLPFSDNDTAGVGALSSKEHAELAEIHEYGTEHIPARPMLPNRETALRDAIKIYEFFIDRATKK